MKSKRKTAKRSLFGTKHRAARRRIKARRAPHKRLVLHPVFIFGLLIVGVYITGLTYRVLAGSYDVSAKVPADPLLEGANITAPAEGAKFVSSPINVSGTCPSNSYVNIYRNSVFSGSAWCTSNTFSVQVELVSGTNTLVAQDFNITDDPGPATPGVNITYSPPPPPAIVGEPGQPVSTIVGSNSASSNSNSNQSASEQPIVLTTDYHFQTFDTDKNFSWEVTVEGGEAPYQVHIDWGDTQTTDMTVKSKTFKISHIYTSAGYYPIKLKIRDAKNRTSFLQLAALIKLPGALGFLDSYNNQASQQTPVPNLSLAAKIKKWLWVIWPVYVTTVLMAVSFWLGERQELERFLKAANASRRRLRHP